MGFITLTTTGNKEVVINVAQIILMEESHTGGTALYLHDKSSVIEFVEKPNQVIFMLRAAGANVITG